MPCLSDCRCLIVEGHVAKALVASRLIRRALAAPLGFGTGTVVSGELQLHCERNLGAGTAQVQKIYHYLI